MLPHHEKNGKLMPPPAALNAERALLACWLHDNTTIMPALKQIGIGDFSTDLHQRIARAAVALHLQGRPADIVTVFEAMDGAEKHDATALADINELTATPANMASYAAIVAEAAARRRLSYFSERFSADVADGSRPVADMVAEARTALDAVAGETERQRWPKPLTAAELAAGAKDVEWLWRGVLARGHVTLFSALMKAGKSTMLAHLLTALASGTTFLGRETAEEKCLIVSEESESIWRRRCDSFGLQNCLFLCRPFNAKPTFSDWQQFISYLSEFAANGCGLIVLDTLGAFAPWKNENDAAEVAATLAPLNLLTRAGLAVMLVHHMGKSDQTEGKGARGSTALAGAADILMELRRYVPDDRQDRRRVLTGFGRFDEVPDEVVIELAGDGSGYTALGDRKAERDRELAEAIRAVLPTEPPGATAAEIHDELPAGRPRESAVRGILVAGAEAANWNRTGTGRPPKDPFRFWRPA
jgi:hypothetical protein